MIEEGSKVKFLIDVSDSQGGVVPAGATGIVQLISGTGTLAEVLTIDPIRTVVALMVNLKEVEEKKPDASAE